jgi:anti-anti-sigma regulatory factor
MPRFVTSLRFRILVLLAGVALIAAGATAAVTYFGGRNALEAAAFDLLAAVRENKANQVEDFYRQTCDQVVTSSDDLMVVNAMDDLATGYRAIETPSDAEVRTAQNRELADYYNSEFLPRLSATTGVSDLSVGSFLPRSPQAREIQFQYIADNPFPTSAKSQLDDTGLDTLYSSSHGLYHPILRDFADRFGYHDLFLIDADGEIVYSVAKEVDFGTSLEAGPYRDSNLAEAFRRALDSDDRGFCGLVDFAPYPPSYNAPASFIASPIAGEDGEVVGVLAYQMPTVRINEIMTSGGRWEDVGLGASGETYIVAEDLTLRSESRFLLEDKASYLAAIESAGLPADTVAAIDLLDSSIGLQIVDTPGTTAAHDHLAGTDIFDDYRGISVLSSFRPLDIQGMDWVIMSEIDESEAFAAADEFGRRALLTLLIASVIIVVIAIWFSSRLVRPINSLSESAAVIAEGDLEAPVDTEGQGEIGDLARSFQKMQQAISRMVRGQERQIEALTTPLIPLRDDVVVLPIVGELDPRRSAKLGEGLVSGVYERSARVAIIDLTGMRVTDSRADDEDAVRALSSALHAVRLMGVQVILTGMQAEVARRITESEIDMADIETEATLQSGIDRASRTLRGHQANGTGD